MLELIEEITAQARKSKYVDQASGVSARFSLSNYRTMVASARQRAVLLKEDIAVPRISDLGHLYTSSLGKLEIDLMGAHQMSEKKILDAIIANAIKEVFEQYVDLHGVQPIAEIFNKGVRIEVGDLLPSSHYAEKLKHVPPVWETAFEVNAGSHPAIRASCIEFVLAGLYSMDRISRASKNGKVSYET
jgi:magnesium chelatase subunit I